VTYLIVSPLAGGLPAHTSFDLPYKDAQFVLNRTSEGKPMTFPVRREGKQLVIQDGRQTTSGGGKAVGRYRLNLKACNPGCEP
jgi:hypothetical protein